MFVSAMETITLKEMITAMDKGELFSMAFRTCDIQKNKGGEYIFIDKACKQSILPGGNKRSDHTSIVASKRNPNHFENSTRNIRVIPEGNIMKVHLRLIRKFNGKTVL